MNILYKDFGLLATIFMAVLKKGDEFTMCKKSVYIKSVFQKKVSDIELISDTAKEKFPEEKITTKLILTYGEDTITFHYVFGKYKSGILSKNRRNKSMLKTRNFLSDIETLIIIDSVNRNNPFHDFSFVTNTIKERYEENYCSN